MEDNSSKNQQNKKDFPGYPHYPANEDALSRPDLDKEERDNDDDIVMGTDADVNSRDADSLDDTRSSVAELDNTDDDGDPLNEDDDLDVPGSELDDADEQIGEEDEENNYYSLGGDEKENLEEDNSRE